MQWRWIVLVLVSGCYEIGEEIGEEIDAWSDHSFTLGGPTTRLVVGGSGQLGLTDACTPVDNEECTYDTFTVTDVKGSGQVTGSDLGGSQIRVTALREPGSGSITVTATSAGATASASISFTVLLPEAAIVTPSCPFGLQQPDGPLAPTDAEARIHWTFMLDGHNQPGDSGMNYVDAPDLTIVSMTGSSALYRTPTTPGVITVKSTLGPSQFDYEIYDPTTAALATLVGGESSAHDGIYVGFQTAVGGRITCIDPPGKQVTSLTPDVCLIRPEDSPLVATIATTERRLNVAPIAAGSCAIELAIPALGLAETQTFDVTPFPPENRIWDQTCSPAQGTTCGLKCPFRFTDANDCDWIRDTTTPIDCSADLAQLRCRYTSNGTCSTPTTTRADESACWAE